MKTLFVQFMILVFFIMIDLFVFRGYYSSKVCINTNDAWNSINYSCKLKVEKKADDKYLFTFENNSLIPQFFVNYRNEDRLQVVSDTLFFSNLGSNLFPANNISYSKSFTCGTGLAYTSINPFESFEIIKTYDDILKEICSIHMLENYIDQSQNYYNSISFVDLNRTEIDSIMEVVRTSVSTTDSIHVEYYFEMDSYILKNHTHIKSNRIKISFRDLLDMEMLNE